MSHEDDQPKGENTSIVAVRDLSDTPTPAFDDSIDYLPEPAFEEIGHYQVIELLGQGGFGTVVKAYDRKLLRVVALKLMLSELAATSPARKRFLREARAGAAVRHENVVCIHAVEETPVPYLVMEYVPGVSLQKYLDEHGPLPIAEVMRIGARLARGLAAAHATGLIHRDVKPANVMLQPGEQLVVKLTDFGLARTVDDVTLTRSGLVSGTPMYMAPEQARGEKPDHRSDLFSLGSVLYVMVTGRPPFRADSSLAVMARVAEATPRAIEEIIPETPVWLCAIIGKLHARDPDDRYASAEEVAKVLERSLAAWQLGAMDISPLPSGAAVPAIVVSPQEKAKPVPSRRWPILTVASLVFLGAMAALWLGFRPKPIEPIAEVVVNSPAALSQPVVAEAAVSGPSPELAHRHLANRVTTAIRRLNPQFIEPIDYEFEERKIVGVSILNGFFLIDTTPFRELIDLRRFKMYDADFENFEGFRGLPLNELVVIKTRHVCDLSALKGMPLKLLTVWGYRGTDLTPLQGMKLRSINLGQSDVRDISVLRGMPLEFLCMNISNVDDLEPLRGMPLKQLLIEHTKVTDLAPLKGMKLDKIALRGIAPKNRDAIWDMPLEYIDLDVVPNDIPRLRSLTTLKRANDMTADEFFKSLK